jgi:hypothetical protein
MLPDSSLWVSEFATTLVDVALKGRPYVYKPSMTKKPNNAYKWLLPLVLAGQVRTRVESIFFLSVGSPPSLLSFFLPS